MKKKKGFTLVELLAVIIILAVIALITTPLVLNVVDSAKKSAFESSAYGVIETAKMNSMENLLNEGSMEAVYTFPNSGIDVQGEQPKGGQVAIDKQGRVAIAIHNGKWCALKDYDESTIGIIEYDEKICVLKEKEIIYYGYIDDGDYKVSLMGDIVDYSGTEKELSIPENFSGESYYEILNIPACVEYLGIAEEAVSYDELKTFCYLYLKVSGIKPSEMLNLKYGYIEYHNVSINPKGCETLLNLSEKLEIDSYYSELFTSCDLEEFYANSFTINDLYNLGVVIADEYIVNKYEITNNFGTELINYELNKEKCLSLVNSEGMLSESVSFLICHSEISSSKTNAEAYEQLVTNGLMTLKDGYYKFSDIKFNYDQCSSIFLELGEMPSNCSYEFLIDSGMSINSLYESGIITADRIEGRIENEYIKEQYRYELNEENCITYIKGQDSTLTDDDALKECNSIYAEIMLIDNSNDRTEYVTEFLELANTGIINRNSTVFAIKNVTLNEDGCKKYMTTIGGIDNSCTEEFITSGTYTHKFLYKNGIITGDLMDINENVIIKENDSTKDISVLRIGAKAFYDSNLTKVTFPATIITIGKEAFRSNDLIDIEFPNSIITIGKDAFLYNNLSGKLDLSYLTNLKKISGFSSNGITEIKLPNSVEKIEEDAFSHNQISETLDLSYLPNLKYISGFNGNEITAIKLPEKLEIIGKTAFSYNEISDELDLSDTNLKTIGKDAFLNNKLNSIKLPKTITTISSRAFEKTSNSNSGLVTIVNPSGKSFDWDSITSSNTLNQNFVTGTITHQDGDITVTDK